MLSAEAVSEPAKELCAALRPADTVYEMRRRQGQTTAAKEMMVLRGSPSFSGVKDVRGSLARADMGGMLNTRELLDISGVLACARGALSYGNGERGGINDVDYLFNSLTANKYLEEKISTSISGEDEVADLASRELADIRRKMRAADGRFVPAVEIVLS